MPEPVEIARLISKDISTKLIESLNSSLKSATREAGYMAVYGHYYTVFFKDTCTRYRITWNNWRDIGQIFF